MYSLQHENIAHIAVQLQPNERFSNCVLLYWLYKLYCSGRLEEVHRGNDCSYTICTEMVLQWHCLLNNVVCSTAIDCCSAFRHKLLDTERSVTSHTDRIEEPNIGHSSVSVYTQLHVTSGEFLHNRPIYDFLSTSCEQCDLKIYLLRMAELQDIYILLFNYYNFPQLHLIPSEE